MQIKNKILIILVLGVLLAIPILVSNVFAAIPGGLSSTSVILSESVAMLGIGTLFIVCANYIKKIISRN